jgi:hypothetical protein
MQFLLVFTDAPGAASPDPAGMAEMGKYARELAARKILKRGAPLAAEFAAACARVRDGKAFVTDGPFAESREVIGGFCLIDVADRDEAIEIARKCPHARHASVQVHRVSFRGEFGDAERGTPFLLVFRNEPGSGDPDGARGRAMREFGEELVRTQILFETGRLADHEPPARVTARAGKAFVTDGPFAESKEAIGGYALIRAAGRAEAIELAGRFPHARWGPVEVREILFFDRA